MASRAECQLDCEASPTSAGLRLTAAADAATVVVPQVRGDVVQPPFYSQNRKLRYIQTVDCG
jgi:hypothetical protein